MLKSKFIVVLQKISDREWTINIIRCGLNSPLMQNYGFVLFVCIFIILLIISVIICKFDIFRKNFRESEQRIEKCCTFAPLN